LLAAEERRNKKGRISMNQTIPLRLLSYVSMAFAMGLAILALTTRFSPAAPAYLTFLFTGLIGSFAVNSIKDLERRMSAVEQRGRT
jgi:hypothetical protein